MQNSKITLSKNIYSVFFPIIILCLILPFFGKAQTPAPIVTFAGNNPTYVYVGSLTLAINDASNDQKLRIDIFGGGWDSSTVGETTYYISNRGGLTIHQVTTGGAGIAGYFTLQGYQNGSKTDFYLFTPATAYSAIAVLSYVFGGANSGFVTISNSYSAPAETAITPLNITQVMTTDASGNMAINSANTYPQYKLAINGAMVATSATVKLYDKWPDYVFKPNYDLPTLNRLKTFIDQNHHLPGIPSEAEVYKKGLNLGDLDKTLVKKVEELTLYLIEKDAEIKILKGDNTEMKEEVELMGRRIEAINKRLDGEKN